MGVGAGHLVQRFYHEVWNEADETVAREILHADLRFKASLGPVRTGPEGFIDYMRSIHAGLAGYRCVIDDRDGYAGRRTSALSRHSSRPFLRYAPDGQRYRMDRRGVFTTDGCQITDIWVLGDVDAVKQQLGVGTTSSFAP